MNVGRRAFLAGFSRLFLAPCFSRRVDRVAFVWCSRLQPGLPQGLQPAKRRPRDTPAQAESTSRAEGAYKRAVGWRALPATLLLKQGARKSTLKRPEKNAAICSPRDRAR